MNSPAVSKMRETLRDAGLILSEGWRLSKVGLKTAFPWVLAAEVLPALPFMSTHSNILTADLDQMFQPDDLWSAIAWGVLASLLYSVAVARIAVVTEGEEKIEIKAALRAVPGILIAYLIYEVIVIVGCLVALIFFTLGIVTAGVIPAVVAAFIPLAPTAYVSTALALFIFPAVMERRGPLSALDRSWQLTRSSWGCAALVISVPAIALLVTLVGEHVGTVVEGIRRGLQAASEASPDMTQAQMEGLVARSTEGLTPPSPWWHLLWAVLGAFAWWYTLAVCYAQYRYLRMKEVH